MTYKKAMQYFDALSDNEKARFNLLVTVAAKLGKPTEGCYEYAHTIMEEKK